MFDFNNKKLAITGGGSGIGKATARLFAKQGAEVHIVDINEEGIRETAAEISATGGKAFGHVCDITKQEKVKEVFNAIKKN